MLLARMNELYFYFLFQIPGLILLDFSVLDLLSQRKGSAGFSKAVRKLLRSAFLILYCGISTVMDKKYL